MPNTLSERVQNFTQAVTSDANELIGRTVLKATGQHFDDYVRSGGVPPISFFFKAYAASTNVHLRQIIIPRHAVKALEQKSGEIINSEGVIIGHTPYSLD